MDRISPNLIHAFVLAISRVGLLPVLFHKFVTQLWPLIDVLQHEKHYSVAIVRFSDNSSFVAVLKGLR